MESEYISQIGGGCDTNGVNSMLWEKVVAANFTDGCDSLEDFITADDCARAIASISDDARTSNVHPTPSDNELSCDEEVDAKAFKRILLLYAFVHAESLGPSHVEHFDSLESDVASLTMCKHC